MWRGKGVRCREGCAPPRLGANLGRERRRAGGAASWGRWYGVGREERRRVWGHITNGREVRRNRAARLAGASGVDRRRGEGAAREEGRPSEEGSGVGAPGLGAGRIRGRGGAGR